jgi:hypothetical protein
LPKRRRNQLLISLAVFWWALVSSRMSFLLRIFWLFVSVFSYIWRGRQLEHAFLDLGESIHCAQAWPSCCQWTHTHGSAWFLVVVQAGESSSSPQHKSIFFFRFLVPGSCCL